MDFTKGSVYKTCQDWGDKKDNMECEIFFMINKDSKAKYGNHVGIPGGTWVTPSTETEYLEFKKANP